MDHSWCLLAQLILFGTVSAAAIVSNSSDQLVDVRIQHSDHAYHGETSYPGTTDKCFEQLHSSLEKLRRRQEASRVSSLIDLSGYALHQSLRNAPVDMYVTDIKVRAPSVGSWVQVQKCQFSRQAEMSTHLLFNDLLVSGVVRLLPGDMHLSSAIPTHPSESCTMTLRLRRAGLDLKASPAINGGSKTNTGRGFQLRTESNFVDPHFLSVHAYGCRLDKWSREGWFPQGYQPENEASRSARTSDTDPELRIISLGDEPNLEHEQSSDDDTFRQRILTFTNPSEKLAAVLSVKKQIQQQTNAVFQTHGPFSQTPTTSLSSVNTISKPLFVSHQDLPKPVPPQSSITELDEKLRPIAHIPYQTFGSVVATSPPKQAVYGSSPPLHEVSSEMEDVFLRGAKALLAKYLEKQLEIPLKEALMTKIGYTVSYG